MTTRRLRGRLSYERVDVGSKSERDALVLHTGEYDYVVRLPGASPFEASDVSHLAGREVEAEGEVDRQYFFVTHWTVEDEH
ncbi:hypothetical protein B7P34_02180 [Streptosporangium nondiastaticum]|uniref:Uncharacterized protein n=1 Tax=Streptosporangium nondiastaticum TaxID=35764 RepID=A0A9X7JVA5_9ACTN|nr:hypothetical protein [Streptosporangium nondiastaticum]PSJ30388.1 hypothetical protein B7P34_02180 [Streptosporangium nondiastaticum]